MFHGLYSHCHQRYSFVDVGGVVAVVVDVGGVVDVVDVVVLLLPLFAVVAVVRRVVVRVVVVVVGNWAYGFVDDQMSLCYLYCQGPHIQVSFA